ncbi:MAG TPA: response regulator [Caldithrix abyssi]|uniref:Response regulator n=1 Tax=Caldithrix abyssi TaxID=187145 RepID=A0A7V1LNW8_CALAY|nr:response regulator [Caldithrix abyssi]
MGNQYTILAVDDNPINVKLLSRTLSNNSYDVITAASGPEALKQAREKQPDLILLDVLMPGMDGYEVCKILKDDEASRHIPIIFLSAKNETVDKARGLALGAVDYLTKPFDPVEIVARIQTHLDARRAVHELSQLNEILAGELDDLRKQKKGESSDGRLHSFVDKLLPVKTVASNDYFQMCAYTKIQAPPATTLFIPLLLDGQHLLYILTGGFRKDYSTSLVQLMMQKYAEGLMSCGKQSFYNEQILMNMLEKILDAFSPDHYDTPFTISLNYINHLKNEYLNLSIHQPFPFIFDVNCDRFIGEGFPLVVESRYTAIVRARRFNLPAQGMMIHFLSGKDTLNVDIDFKRVDCIPGHNTDMEAVTKALLDLVPDSSKDRLMTLIKLK